ncbi:MAG: class I SAM-dependent methyltransferase [Clostridia bacterium]|nr:class I SAM-dependent methyltransferase [Clostridia bacterium]
MDNKNTNGLQKEADFQDSKIEHGVRANQERFYCDRATAEMRECQKQLVGSLKGKRVLDIGCGTGENTISALEEGAFVTAIDISPASIEYVKQCAAQKGLEKNLTAIVMDAQDMQLENGCVDVVIGGGVLHHLPRLEQALGEIARVLTPAGYAVFHEPMGINPLINLYRSATPDKRTDDETPFKTKQLELIKKIFPNTRFVFFDNATLFSKIFIALHMPGLADKLQGFLLKIDRKMLRGKSNKITFAKKMAWIVVLKMQK